MGEQPTDPAPPANWDAHRRAQILSIVTGTTPAQRFEWLEQTVEMLRPQWATLLENRRLVQEHRAPQAGQDVP